MSANEKIFAIKMFLIENWDTVVVAIVGAIGTFRKELHSLITMRQSIKESEAGIESTSLDNLSKTMELYKKLIDDIIPRYEAELKEYKEELNYYKAQLEKYREDIRSRDKEIVSLHKEINDLKVEIIKIKGK